MRHLRHIVAVAAAIIVAAVPAALADPAVRSIVDHHPGIAAYFPLVSGVVYALYKAWRNAKVHSTYVPRSSGSPTMGARS